MTEKQHCFECAGHATAKGEDCSTCDGRGNLKKIKPVKPQATKRPKKKLFG